MNKEQESRIMLMAMSADEEMQALGAIAFAETVSNWDEYVSMKERPDYKKIPQTVRKQFRQTMINSHGRIRKKFKSW